MTVPDANVVDLRRMVNELDNTNYSDNDLIAILDKYPIMDERGENPYYWVGAVPVREENQYWIPTYNINLAASEVWENKAAQLAGKFDFSADGGNYSQSQAYQQALGMAKYYRGRGGVTTIKQIKAPDEIGQSAQWIGNLPEPPDPEGYD